MVEESGLASGRAAPADAVEPVPVSSKASIPDAHTPGPWDTYQCDLAGRIAITSDGGTIAVVSYPDDGCDEANAHLIAAAPTMLEALERARSQLIAHLLDHMDAEHAVKEVAYIDAAIALARGEAK